MYSKKIVIVLLLVILLLTPKFTFAQEFKESFLKAEVTQILEDKEIAEPGTEKNYFQKVQLKILDGPDENKIITLDMAVS